MKLIDLLVVIGEHTKTKVYTDYGELIGIYDGRNSIPNELNDEEVKLLSVCTDGESLYIRIA